jgi:polyisoprenoid-binding protein YceI
MAWLTMLMAGIAFATASLTVVVGQAPREEAKPEGKAPGRLTVKPSLQPGQIDLEKSRVYVYVGKKGLGHAHAVEGKIKSGSIDLYADSNPGKIVFDMASFAVDTDTARKYAQLKGSIAESTQEQITETMQGADVLDVEKFSTATFQIKSSEQTKTKKHGHTIELKGDFTLHGQTQPLTLQAQIERKDGQGHLRGDFTILQSDFGITPYKAALGTVGVADELKIWGDIWFAEPKTTDK